MLAANSIACLCHDLTEQKYSPTQTNNKIKKVNELYDIFGFPYRI